MKGSVRKRGKTWSYRIDLGKNSDQRAQIEKVSRPQKLDLKSNDWEVGFLWQNIVTNLK